MAKSPHHVKIVIFKDDGTVEWAEEIYVVVDFDPDRLGIDEDGDIEGIEVQAFVPSAEEQIDPPRSGHRRIRYGVELIDSEPTRWKEVGGGSSS